jgi:hypothetical protein
MTNGERAADLSGQIAEGENLRALRKEVACELHRLKRSTLNVQRSTPEL